MVDSTIRIIVDPSGAVRGTRVVNRALDSTTAKAQTTTSAVTFLRRAIGLLGAGLVIRQVVGFADSFTQLQNRIRVTGRQADALTSATERLLLISRRTRTDLEANVSLFQRLGIAQQQLGATSEDLFQFVQTVGNALSIQGAAAGTSRGAVLQLSQAIGSTVVRAEEFNSILEGAFPIALAAARGIDRAAGSVAKLRQIVIEGGISSKEFFNAILSQSDQLAEQFGRTTPTISQAFTVLNNELINFVGQIDKAEGLSSGFARSVLKLAINLDTAAKALGVLLALFAPVILAAIASGLRTAAVAAFAFTVALGPIAIITSLLSAAAAAVFLFGESFKPVEGSIATLQDIGVAAFELLTESIIDLSENGFDVLTETVEETSSAWGKAFQFMENVLNIFGKIMRTFANIVINSFRVMLESARTFGEVLGKIIIGDISGAASAGSGLFGRITEIFSEDAIAILTQQGTDLVNKVGKAILERAEARRREIEARDKGAGLKFVEDDLAPISEAIELTKKQVTALRRLQDQLDPVAAAQREVAEATDLLNLALAAGAIGADEFLNLNTRLTAAFRDQLDPLAAVNRELEEERELFGLSSQAREVEIELRSIENTLRQQGVTLSMEERELLRDNIQSLFAMNEQLELQQQLFEDIRGPQEDYGKQLAALDNLLMQDRISFEEFDDKVRELKLTLLDNNDDLASGFERGLLRSADHFNDFASLAERTVVNAFQGMEDALVKFVDTGKLSFRDLVDSIFNDILRLSVREGITGPLASLLAGGGSKPGTSDASLGQAAANFAGGFEHGGSFTVPGVGGRDSRLVELRATPGEKITVTTPGGAESGKSIVNNNTFNIRTQDASSFKNSQNQVLSQFAAQLSRVSARNG